MELFYPSKNVLEIRKPFPILARHAGKVLILFSGLFGAVGMVTGSGDIPVLVHVLSIVGVLVFGPYHLSGFGPLEELGQRQCADSAPQQETEAAFEPPRQPVAKA
ncbi:MAG: hypothetical protein J5X22_23030 [Candidatus Accumulibacter sp.]|uniref:hypothetical protein n=1 Tax=Accumulibacter sp. TaxID=2053492 RepID=UPI001B17E28A|nr:hypothetical protein [Accumulibacter sp.]MBO3713240.1 hypothetical protein [Accumulibacter sp.]